eukprot:CAMPEP_0176369118 /NCGR_PEP_ID=MMETSP0126-20121128/23069_1 /TAXON_ID=141414 ORGANISM="Strombidinopsis acuminatum, Strain SPMC142" /NCGR_SAMPLE_ID=MMETSP0126 /ASSEMBLY_ACC=CAM_ASM_000229 /LENGTH=47 /DNA_ID= /DNA_START= /DNA_END= /DNA_ORIENTATION=
MIKNIDYIKNGHVNYTEFLAATIQIDEKSLTKERRDAVFKMFDVQDS